MTPRRVGLVVLVVALGQVWTFVPGPETGARAQGATTWADLRAGLEALVSSARLPSPEGSETAERTVVHGPAGAPVGDPSGLERALGSLDGANFAGAAAAVWRTIFGRGVSVLVPTPGRPPHVRAVFPDAAAGARFLRERIARTRARLQGRSGPAPVASALEGRLRAAAVKLSEPEVQPAVGDTCGPVAISASGDTTALGRICADLDTYWQVRETPRAQAPLRIHPVRTGGLPSTRETTETLSTVEPLLADLLTVAGEEQATTPAAPARPGTPAPVPQAAIPVPTPSPPATQRAAADVTRTVAPGATDVPAAAAPEGGAGQEPSGPPSRWAPVLAAAREPRRWTAALGGVAALAIGVWLLRTGRDLGRAGAWSR